MRLNIDGAIGTTLEQVRDIYKLTADEKQSCIYRVPLRRFGLVAVLAGPCHDYVDGTKSK